MTLFHELEIKVETVVSGTFKDYYEKLKKNLQYMGERLQKFRSQRLENIKHLKWDKLYICTKLEVVLLKLVVGK